VQDYPECLHPFLRRQVRLGTIRELRALCVDDVIDPPLFVKPAPEQKKFDGHVARYFRDLIKTAAFDGEYPIWFSDVIRFESEYRFFVHHHRVVGVGHYRGDPLRRGPDGFVVQQAVKVYTASGVAPVSYCLDFGVTSDGSTVLVEVNDGFAFGNYGLRPSIHAHMLEDRWCQMVGLPIQSF